MYLKPFRSTSVTPRLLRAALSLLKNLCSSVGEVKHAVFSTFSFLCREDESFHSFRVQAKLLVVVA